MGCEGEEDQEQMVRQSHQKYKTILQEPSISKHYEMERQRASNVEKWIR